MKKIVTLLMVIIFSFGGAFAKESASKSVIYTDKAPKPIGTYSQAIKIDNTVYISGQIPMDPKTGELVSGEFKTQAKQAMMNLSEIAKAAGGTLDDIVKVTVYLSDLSNFSIFNQVMAEYFQKPYPARVVVEVKALPKQAAVEIEAVMRVR